MNTQSLLQPKRQAIFCPLFSVSLLFALPMASIFHYFNLPERLFALALQVASQWPVAYYSFLVLCIIALGRFYLKLKATLGTLAEQKQQQVLELESFTYQDYKTSLANRACLYQLSKQWLNSETDNPFALFIIELNNLKKINMIQGHETGDKLIDVYARRLTRFSEKLTHDTYTARINGGEFCLINKGLSNKIQTLQIANQLQALLNEPITLPGRFITPDANIGIALAPLHGSKLTELMKHAEMAINHARHTKRSVCLYQVEFQAAIDQQYQLELELAQALSDMQFSMHYQPLFDLRQNRVVGVEALIRWQHPEKGNIPPDYFIPIAENSGMIIPIGEWIIKQVCSDIGAIANQYSLFVTVNISARQLQQKGLVPYTQEQMQRHRLHPGNFHFELTEHTLVDVDNKSHNQLSELQQSGLKLWIDDFGTGYSSFSYLNKYAFAGLKLDRSFTCKLLDSPKTRAITRAIITLTKALRLDILAEGVEQEAELELLRTMGCNKIQGYWISKPMPLEDLELWLEEQEPGSRLVNVNINQPVGA